MDHTDLPADLPVPGLFIPFNGLTAEDITAITAITGRRRRPEPETTPAAPAPTPPIGSTATNNNTQPATAATSGAWSLAEVDLVLRCLEHAPNGSIRGLAIREALDSDGTVTREQIYQLGYPQDRALKGFSRPVDSAIRALTASGKLAPAVRPPLLAPYYEYGSAGTATGYHVPPELLSGWKTRTTGTEGQAA